MAGISRVALEHGELRIYVEDIEALPSVGNVDVEVVDCQHCRWAATFFTLEGIEMLFQKNVVSGECAAGTYLWASDMILVRTLSVSTIERTIRDLTETGEFERAFARLPEE